MKVIFVILIFTFLASCGGNIESCSTSDFDGFEFTKIYAPNYSVFADTFIKELDPAISYKYKKNSMVSFVKGRDFTLLCFELSTNKNINLKSINIDFAEAKIKLGKCYTKCGYLGRILKFRSSNSLGDSIPSFKIFSSSLTKKIIASNYLYLEGQMQNLGIFIDGKEYIFLPIEKSSLNSLEDFFIKSVLIKNNNKWTVYIFYSKHEISTDVIANIKQEYR